MKKVTAFILENCPHCRKAIKIIDELKSNNKKYADIDIEFIEESKNVKLASTYDYYFVPTFYVDGVKLHEGVPTHEKIEKVLIEAAKWTGSAKAEYKKRTFTDMKVLFLFVVFWFF